MYSAAGRKQELSITKLRDHLSGFVYTEQKDQERGRETERTRGFSEGSERRILCKKGDKETHMYEIFPLDFPFKIEEFFAKGGILYEIFQFDSPFKRESCQ